MTGRRGERTESFEVAVRSAPDAQSVVRFAKLVLRELRDHGAGLWIVSDRPYKRRFLFRFTSRVVEVATVSGDGREARVILEGQPPQVPAGLSVEPISYETIPEAHVLWGTPADVVASWSHFGGALVAAIGHGARKGSQPNRQHHAPHVVDWLDRETST